MAARERVRESKRERERAGGARFMLLTSLPAALGKNVALKNRRSPRRIYAEKWELSRAREK